MDVTNESSVVGVAGGMPAPERKPSRRLFWFALILAIVVLASVKVVGEYGKQEGPVFSKDTQFVPEGTTPLDVDQALAAFGFTAPLPFFDARNVLQSLTLSSSLATEDASSSPEVREQGVAGGNSGNDTSVKVSQSTPPVYLSYRIFGQEREVVQSAFVEYFRNTGWTAIEGQSLMFLSGTNALVSVRLLSDEQSMVASISIE